MNQNEDHVGKIMWTIPLSDQDARDEFIRSSKAAAKKIREGDFNEHIEIINSNIPEINIPKGSSQESVKEKIAEGIEILDSICYAAESGKPGQSILTAVYGDGVLHGFAFNPENGVTMQTTITVRVPEGTEDILLTPIILGILSKWSKATNSIVAWNAIKILNPGVNLPESWPRDL